VYLSYGYLITHIHMYLFHYYTRNFCDDDDKPLLDRLFKLIISYVQVPIIMSILPARPDLVLEFYYIMYKHQFEFSLIFASFQSFTITVLNNYEFHDWNAVSRSSRGVIEEEFHFLYLLIRLSLLLLHSTCVDERIKPTEAMSCNSSQTAGSLTSNPRLLRSSDGSLRSPKPSISQDSEIAPLIAPKSKKRKSFNPSFTFLAVVKKKPAKPCNICEKPLLEADCIFRCEKSHTTHFQCFVLEHKKSAKNNYFKCYIGSCSAIVKPLAYKYVKDSK
jgi:hypothetical protein